MDKMQCVYLNRRTLSTVMRFTDDMNVLQASICCDIYSGVTYAIILDWILFRLVLKHGPACSSFRKGGGAPRPWAQNVMTDWSLWSLYGPKFSLISIANCTTKLESLAVNYEGIFHASACLMYRAALYSPVRNILSRVIVTKGGFRIGNCIY
jgi:hypothetical protein